MATTTPRIGLTKPDGTDLVDIAVLNTNFDKIDSNIASTKIQATKPTTANSGDLWWDSDTGTLYVYYVGASSSSWVAATSDPINIGVVANQTERDAQYPTPAQGMSVWRQDLGAQETYYGLYNSSTNPGGRDTAGWYTTTRAGGLIPVRPTTVTIASGTGSANALGVTNVTNATSVTLENVFTNDFENYRLLVSGYFSANTDFLLRFRTGGADITSGYYEFGYYNYTTLTGHQRPNAGNIDFIWQTYAGGDWGQGVIDIFSPNVSKKTGFSHQSFANNAHVMNGYLNTTTPVQGMTLYCSAGNFSGSIQMLGYND